MNYHKLNNRPESFIIVHTGPLCETPEDLVRLIAIKRPICEQFVLIDPLASHNINTWRERHKAPCVIGEQSIVLSLHSSMRIGV